MSGDRLAHLESLARDPLKLYAMVALAPNLYASDVLALVEIAKAARELCDGGQDLAAPFAALRSALARLDSGAAEEGT